MTITGTATGPKKNIFVSGGQHAREWIAPATTLYIITQLITLYQSDPTVKALLDSTQFYFVPLVNVDGYAFTWTGSNNRLWRKNRRLNTGGSYGVDLNRNWDDHWGTVGTSHTPSSDTYCGTAAFSEPESKAVSSYSLSVGPIVGAIDYHSYSQLILRPYGWTTDLPPGTILSLSLSSIETGYSQRQELVTLLNPRGNFIILLALREIGIIAKLSVLSATLLIKSNPLAQKIGLLLCTLLKFN